MFFIGKKRQGEGGGEPYKTIIEKRSYVGYEGRSRGNSIAFMRPCVRIALHFEYAAQGVVVGRAILR